VGVKFSTWVVTSQCLGVNICGTHGMQGPDLIRASRSWL
jgi:hypothetical protein